MSAAASVHSEDSYLTSGGVSSSLPILSSQPKIQKSKDELYLQGYGRQFGDQMTYSVGCAYGTGLFLGGTWGFLEGVRRGGETRKLWVNSVVNGCTTRGPLVANQFGIITLFYVINNNLFSMVRDHDSVNAAAAGAVSGALFKSCAGWQLAGRYAAASAVAFAAIDYAKNKLI